jgi:iron complex transport system substrate-binding protein
MKNIFRISNTLSYNNLIFLIVIFLSVTLASCNKKASDQQAESSPESVQRIVSLQGAITEIVAGLGYQDQLVGVDVTSTFPETVKKQAQDLGHVRSITIESILELQPTLILASDRDLNQSLLEKIEASGIPLHLFSQEYSIEGTQKLIQEVAAVLGTTNYQELLETIDQDYNQVVVKEPQPRVLFIYARGAGTLMVAGNNTPMKKMVELAGGHYAIHEFDDFKPLTPESLIASNPDVLLFFDSGLQSLGGVEGVLQIQGVTETNAGKNRKIISLEGGFLSGFGPRVGKAAAQLNKQINE